MKTVPLMSQVYKGQYSNVELCMQRTPRKNTDKLTPWGNKFLHFNKTSKYFKKLIHICMEIPTLWYNVTPLTFASWLSKLCIETTKSSSDLRHFRLLTWDTSESVHGKSGSYILALICLWKKQKSQKSSTCKTHHHWHQTVNHQNTIENFIFSHMNPTLKCSGELLFQAELSWETKESHSFLV